MERVLGDGGRDPPVRFALGIVASPAEQVVRLPRRAAASIGDFLDRFVGDFGFQFAGTTADDFGNFSRLIEIQVEPIDEPVAERPREQSRAGRRPNHGKPLQFDVDRAGIEPLTQGDIDAKVFHRRIDILFDRGRHAMDFIDEQHGAVTRVRDVGEQIFGALSDGPEAICSSVPSSLGITVASVVFPRPGGPSNKRWPSGSFRFLAASSMISRRSSAFRWPTTSDSR